MDTQEKEPLVHAHVVQNRLRDLDLYLDKDVRERILMRIPKNTLQTINQAKKDAWLPVKLNVEITDCMAAEIGIEGVYKLSFDSFTKVINSSVVSPFVRAGMNLLKIKPSTMLMLSPMLWKSIYRNCGEMTIDELGPTRLRITLNNLPEFVINNSNYLMAIAGGFHAVNSFSDVKGMVIVEKTSVETRQVSFIVSWISNLTKDK